MKRLVLLGVSGFSLTFPCLTAWLLLPDDHKVIPFLVWLFGVLYLTAVFTVPAAHQEPPATDVPSASAADDLEFTPVDDVANWLRNIARDVRSAGDMSLVLLSDDGVGPAPITLSDELWLVAFQLDHKLVTLSATEDAASRRTQLTEGDET